MFQQISTRQEGNAWIITIERESKMNALNIALLQEMREAVLSVQNNMDIRGIIITGSGEKAFAAGADISEFAGFTSSEAKVMSSSGHEVMNAIERSVKPVIAAVNGFALGGGCELALACHFRIASENARFGQPEVNLGVPPGYGGTQRLLHIVGKGRSLHMLLTADAIDAQTALQWGLVSAVYPIGSLLEEALKLVNKLSTKSPQALAQVIDCVNTYYNNGLNGMEKEIQLFSDAFQTPDFLEGTQAFLNKRKPEY